MLPLHSSFLYFMQTSDPTSLDPLAISLFKEMVSISSLWKTSSPFFVQEITACVDLEVDAAISLRQITKQSCRAMHKLLYENARVTVGESLLLTMAFIMRYKLSMVASDDLLKLLELHCPMSSLAVKEMSKFRQYFQYLSHPIKQHYCCPNPKCQVYISAEKPGEEDVCRVCGELLSGKSFFIEAPVEEQLQTILSREYFSFFGTSTYGHGITLGGVMLCSFGRG